MNEIKMLQNQLNNIQSQLAELSSIVAKLSARSDRRTKATQTAIDDLHNSIKLIFVHGKIPNVGFNLNMKHVIDK